MGRRCGIGWVGIVGVVVLLSAQRAAPAAEQAGKTPPAAAEPLWIGGGGGAYFLAQPGELWVEVEKRDRRRPTTPQPLRALLVATDRTVIQELSTPDALPADPAAPQRVRLTAQVTRPGIYALNVTVARDRYGEQVFWRMRTNCPKYLIETSRGHRDARHEEPLLFANPDRPGDVCFRPQARQLSIEITGLPKGSAAPVVYDAQGNVLATLAVDAKGQAAHTFEAAVARDAAPWRLHLPVAQATVQIDGLTRWSDNDRDANFSLWSPAAGAFFPFQEYRWLLAPYRLTCYGKPGATGAAKFIVYNNAPAPRTIDLRLEFAHEPWPARLSADHLTLKPNQDAAVTLEYTVPTDGQRRQCHLRATPREAPAVTTYSTLDVVAGTAPAARPLELPLVLQPYAHENEQLGYRPDYPVESQPYFDAQNRAFIRAGRGLATWREGAWEDWALKARPADAGADVALRPAAASGSKIAFDNQGHLYLPGTLDGRPALLDSADGGRTFVAWPLPGAAGRGGTLEIEDFTGHNAASGPPPMLRYTERQRDPKLFWRRLHDLELFLPRRVGGRVEFVGPILVTSLCLGLASHSGIPSSVVSSGGRVHVIWGEATDPAVKVPGAPTFVASYDADGKRLGEPALVGYGPPANDIHNSPSITVDSRGYLHVLGGTHGKPFPYARSLQPHTAHGGWTEPVPVAEGEGLTYIGLVCGRDDTLHLVCRWWRTGQPPFPASHYATLAQLSKPVDGPWQPPRALIVPPFSEYSVYYHRLTIDRTGRLFLSYDYWSTHWFYRNDLRGRRRALMESPDGGTTWKLAAGEDLIGR